MRERAGIAASRSSGPSSTTSASRGPAATAAATTSGPTPRGSPSVTARRGRAGTLLEADVHVGHATELIEVMLLRQVLAQLFANAVLHVFERVVTRRLALGHDQNRELRAAAVGIDRHDCLDPAGRVVADRAAVVGRQVGQGDLLGKPRLAGIAVVLGDRIERRARGES